MKFEFTSVLKKDMLYDVVYTEQKQSNGDILLVKKNLYTDEVVSQKLPNGDILLKRIETIAPCDIHKWDFAKSKIKHVVFDDDPSTKIVNPSFKKVYETLHEKIGDGVKIIKNSVLNIKTVQKIDKGFNWYQDLGISIQSVDSNRAILEAVTQSQKNFIDLDLTIQIKNKIVKISV